MPREATGGLSHRGRSRPLQTCRVQGKYFFDRPKTAGACRAWGVEACPSGSGELGEQESQEGAESRVVLLSYFS